MANDQMNGHAIIGEPGREPSDANMLLLLKQCTDLMMSVSELTVAITEQQADHDNRIRALEMRSARS